MPPTKKPPARRSARPRASAAARARFERNKKAVDRIAKSLEAAQKDLGAVGGSLGTGASDMRKSVTRLLRDARRDVTKLGKAVRSDLERLQKDVAGAAKPKARSARSKASKGRSGAKAKATTKSRTRRAKAK